MWMWCKSSSLFMRGPSWTATHTKCLLLFFLSSFSTSYSSSFLLMQPEHALVCIHTRSCASLWCSLSECVKCLYLSVATVTLASVSARLYSRHSQQWGPTHTCSLALIWVPVWALSPFGPWVAAKRWSSPWCSSPASTAPSTRASAQSSHRSWQTESGWQEGETDGAKGRGDE